MAAKPVLEAVQETQTSKRQGQLTLKRTNSVLLGIALVTMMVASAVLVSGNRWRHLPLADVANTLRRTFILDDTANASFYDSFRLPGSAPDLQNSSAVGSEKTSLLDEIEKYLLNFRSPCIKEPPVGYSWPVGHDGIRTLNTKENKLLVWFNAPDFLKPRANSELFGRCPVSTCSLSRSRQDLAKADVIMFTGAPAGKPVPARTKPNQMFVYFIMESPQHTSSAYQKTAWNSAFNWTWNYRLDSDIFEPVGYLKRATQVPSLDFFRAAWRKKNKTVAWFSSHCNVESKRDEYVKKMKAVIPVDIYGRCGDKNCKNNATYKCESMLNDYMFYLSFENSMCQDYVTEKLYKTFFQDVHVVPVARGGANYSQLLPEGTYVDADLFPSPEALGRHLQDLMADGERYAEMLWRKAHFLYHEHGIVDSFCQLCFKAHHVQKYAHTYPDLFSWLHKDRCGPPRPF